MNRPWRVLAWLLAFVSSLAAAAPLSIEDVWRLPAYIGPTLSDNVMIYAGVDDIRVPLEQMKNMRAALAKYGRSVVWIQKDFEAHGYRKLENNFDLYTQMFEFLDRHIGKAAN